MKEVYVRWIGEGGILPIIARSEATATKQSNEIATASLSGSLAMTVSPDVIARSGATKQPPLYYKSEIGFANYGYMFLGVNYP